MAAWSSIRLLVVTAAVGPGGNQKQAHLSEFAAHGRVRGKVLLTTSHASKCRQFDVVNISGCAEGILPALTWNGRQRNSDPPLAKPVSETRCPVYVGFPTLLARLTARSLN